MLFASSNRSVCGIKTFKPFMGWWPFKADKAGLELLVFFKIRLIARSIFLDRNYIKIKDKRVISCAIYGRLCCAFLSVLFGVVA
ncbi:hypothetical protein HanIR_Chr07g0339591 [Helianthus annuus]|nr:hypothetical protein HanIR_Chr07g0339591 [Helianthus annuus]